MISAILLCYNQKRFIKEQLRAILRQDYQGEWEIIISDDFSQDGSFECLKEMVEKEGGGRRIILHRNESNQGIAGNLQCAVNLARGEWMIKFDGDDIAREDRISSLVSLAEKYPGHLIYAHSCNEIDENGHPIYGRLLPDSNSVVVNPYRECLFDISHVYSHFGGHAMYHRSLFSGFEPMPSGPGIADDTMLSMRAYLKKSGIVQSGKRCSYYRRHNSNICNFKSAHPKTVLIKRSEFLIPTWIMIMKEVYGKHKSGEMSYQDADRLMGLIQAEQRRLLLFPYATFDNSLTTKLKWFWQILQCRPRLWLVSIPRLLPFFLLKRYLNMKDRIKSSAFFSLIAGCLRKKQEEQ